MAVILVTPTASTFSGFTILSTTSANMENTPAGRRFVPFQMVIQSMFTNNNNNFPLAFSDVVTPYTIHYPLVDRLNKNINGEELIRYAGTRRCVCCVYDNLFKVIRVNSCLCPEVLTIPTTV